MDNLVKMFVDSNPNCMFSGGAIGADRLFGLMCKETNTPYIHFSFDDHDSEEDNLLRIPDSNLIESTEIYNSLNKANTVLKRKIPYRKSYVYKLLARNRYQILFTESVYAIVSIETPNTVSGGTAWAIQMYIDQCRERNIPAKIYVFCLKKYKPFYYNNETGEFEECASVPRPTGLWTGIGSRKCTAMNLEQFRGYFV